MSGPFRDDGGIRIGRRDIEELKQEVLSYVILVVVRDVMEILSDYVTR